MSEVIKVDLKAHDIPPKFMVIARVDDEERVIYVFEYTPE